MGDFLSFSNQSALSKPRKAGTFSRLGRLQTLPSNLFPKCITLNCKRFYTLETKIPLASALSSLAARTIYQIRTGEHDVDSSYMCWMQWRNNKEANCIKEIGLCARNNQTGPFAAPQAHFGLKIFQLFHFHTGEPFLIPQRANNWKRGFTQL